LRNLILINQTGTVLQPHREGVAIQLIERIVLDDHMCIILGTGHATLVGIGIIRPTDYSTVNGNSSRIDSPIIPNEDGIGFSLDRDVDRQA
jgi:hypothetical protein